MPERTTLFYHQRRRKFLYSGNEFTASLGMNLCLILRLTLYETSFHLILSAWILSINICFKVVHVFF
jgi:hypothetical protein